MKKTKAILAVILALTMTACSDTNTAEVSDLPDITESSTALTTTTAVETTTTTSAEITTVSETETTTSNSNGTKSEIAKAYADVYCTMIENGNFGAMGFSIGFADVNNDGVPEMLRKDSMRANVNVYNMQGECIWQNVGDPPYEMNLKLGVQSDDNVVLYFSFLQHADYEYYTVEKINGQERLFVDVERNFDDSEVISVVGRMYICSDGNDGSVDLGDPVMSAEGEEAVREMYNNYFGDYEIVNENLWEDINVELSETVGMASFEGTIDECYEELCKIIEDNI